MDHFKKYITTFLHHPGVNITYKTFLNILSPPSCSSCRRLLTVRTILCDLCCQAIKPIVSTMLSITENRDMRIIAITEYRDPLKQLILAKSWSNIVAAQQLGHLIWDYTSIAHSTFDYVVPIPLHWTRYAWRGFNQTEEMGKIIARKSNKPLVHLITRKRSTPFQSSLSTLKRSENVKNVFVLNTHDSTIYHGKHILLIDDLMTTGSTLKEAGKALLSLKPSSITAVVACRVV